MHIVIRTDTDQYQRIYCNIGLLLAAPRMFYGRQRLVRSEVLQHSYLGARLVVSTRDKIECEMQLVFTSQLLHAALAGPGKGWITGGHSECQWYHLISLLLFVLHDRVETCTYQYTLPLSINWSVNGCLVCLQM